MNERIRELAVEAGFYILSDNKICIPTISEEITDCQIKFAELIVQECVKAVSFSYKNEDYDSEWDAALREAESNVKQHFGVE